jgi:hypothetical protein
VQGCGGRRRASQARLRASHGAQAQRSDVTRCRLFAVFCGETRAMTSCDARRSTCDRSRSRIALG